MNIKKLSTLGVLIFAFAISLSLPESIFAQVPPDCKTAGFINQCGTGCGTNATCVIQGPVCFCQSTNPPQNTNNPFGTVKNPLNYGGSTPGTGLIILFNNVLRLVFAGAGVFAFVKILMAGFGFLNAGGDPKKIESAWAGIWQSIIGLAMIISSFAIAAIIGQIFFGNPAAILNPSIYGPN